MIEHYAFTALRRLITQKVYTSPIAWQFAYVFIRSLRYE